VADTFVTVRDTSRKPATSLIAIDGPFRSLGSIEPPSTHPGSLGGSCDVPHIHCSQSASVDSNTSGVADATCGSTCPPP
jgi:hypothetical protein